MLTQRYFTYNQDVKKRLDECEQLYTEHPELKRSFDHCLDTLNRIRDSFGGVVRLFLDFAPYSFEFSVGGLNGGMIFHGGHDGGGDGGGPTLSVCLTPTTGWSLHT